MFKNISRTNISTSDWWEAHLCCLFSTLAICTLSHSTAASSHRQKGDFWFSELQAWLRPLTEHLSFRTEHHALCHGEDQVVRSDLSFHRGLEFAWWDHWRTTKAAYRPPADEYSIHVNVWANPTSTPTGTHVLVSSREAQMCFEPHSVFWCDWEASNGLGGQGQKGREDSSCFIWKQPKQPPFIDHILQTVPWAVPPWSALMSTLGGRSCNLLWDDNIET